MGCIFLDSVQKRNHYFLIDKAVFPWFEPRLCGVYGRILPSIVLDFFVKVLVSLTLVASLNVFRAICCICCFLCWCPLDLVFPCILCLMLPLPYSVKILFSHLFLFDDVDSTSFGDKFEGSGKFLKDGSVILVSLSDQHWRLCILSGWRGRYIKSCQSKRVLCLPNLDCLVTSCWLCLIIVFLGFRPVWASNGELFDCFMRC